MEGTVGSYTTEVVENGLGYPRATFILDHLRRVYVFERERSTMESEAVYTWPAIQEIDIPDDGNITFAALKQNLGVTYAEALEEKTSYVFNVKRLPVYISVAHYNRGTSTPGMTETRTYSYDNKANVLTEMLPNNQVVTYTYHSTYSLPLTQTYKQDANTTIVKQNTLSNSNKTIGQTTTTVNGVLSGKSVYTYDSNGRLTTEKKYRDATNYTETQYVYNSSAQADGGHRKGRKRHRRVLVTGSLGYAAGEIATQSTYNNRGWVTAQTDAEGNTTSFQYDLKGRIARVTNPDASYAAYTYDDVNRTATYTNELGAAMRYEYDYLGNRTGVYDVAGSRYISNSRYNGFGWQFATFRHRTDGGAVKTYLHHDALGRVTQEGNVNSYGTNLSHVTFEYNYTGNQMVTTKTIVGTTTEAPPIATKTYTDNMGYMVKASRMMSTYSEYPNFYTRDYLGNVVTEQDAYAVSIGRSFSHQYTRDYAGRVLTDTDTLNRVTSATYDWLGNKLTSTDPSGTVTSTTMMSWAVCSGRGSLSVCPGALLTMPPPLTPTTGTAT
jgi:YD repeat-containing protein